MRDPGGVVQEMSSPVVTPIGGKDYSRNTNFNCMATSGNPVKFDVSGRMACRARFWIHRSFELRERIISCR